jgi:hypothetical protein
MLRIGASDHLNCNQLIRKRRPNSLHHYLNNARSEPGLCGADREWPGSMTAPRSLEAGRAALKWTGIRPYRLNPSSLCAYPPKGRPAKFTGRLNQKYEMLHIASMFFCQPICHIIFSKLKISGSRIGSADVCKRVC